MKSKLLLCAVLLYFGQTKLLSQIDEEPVFIEIGGPNDPDRIGAPVTVNGEEYYIKSHESRNHKVVTRNDSIGLIENDDFIIPLSNYDNIDLESYGFRVKLKRKFGLFNFQGKQLTPFENTGMHEFLPKICVYRTKNKKSRFYNSEKGITSDSSFCFFERTNSKTKKILVSSDCENYRLFSIDSMKYVNDSRYTHPKIFNKGFLVKKDDKYGGINIEGEKNINFKYDDFWVDWNHSSGTNFIIAKSMNKWGIIDSNENELIPFEYDSISVLSLGPMVDNIYEKIYLVKKNNKWGVIKGPRDTLIEITYDSLYQTKYTSNNRDHMRSLFVARNNDKYKLLNILGDNILENEFDHLEQLDGTDNYKVELNEKIGILSSKNKTVVPIIYDELYTMYERNRFYTKLDQKQGIVDIEAGLTIEASYSSLEPVEKAGYIVTGTEPAYDKGYISYDGKTLLATEFSSILQVREFSNDKWLKGLLVTNRENKIGFFDWKGNQITNFVFDEVEYYNRATMLVKIKNYTFEINQLGECVNNCPKDDELKKLNIIKG